MGTHLTLLGTPTSGSDEVVKALQSAHALDVSRKKSVAQLRKHFPPRVASAAISTALATAEGNGYVTDDGSGHFYLTTSGITHARSVPNRFLYIT